MPATAKARAAVVAVAVASVLLGLALGLAAAAVARRQVDYEALERAWEAGDAAQELRSEGDEQLRRLSETSPADAKALGPQMIFVTLDGGVSEPLADVASRWKEMLWLGGVDVSIYELGASKLLVGLPKGLFVGDLRRFLGEQAHVTEYEWNGETYAVRSERAARRQQQQRRRRKAANKRTAATTHGRASVPTTQPQL